MTQAFDKGVIAGGIFFCIIIFGVVPVALVKWWDDSEEQHARMVDTACRENTPVNTTLISVKPRRCYRIECVNTREGTKYERYACVEKK